MIARWLMFSFPYLLLIWENAGGENTISMLVNN